MLLQCHLAAAIAFIRSSSQNCCPQVPTSNDGEQEMAWAVKPAGTAVLAGFRAALEHVREAQRAVQAAEEVPPPSARRRAVVGGCYSPLYLKESARGGRRSLGRMVLVIVVVVAVCVRACVCVCVCVCLLYVYTCDATCRNGLCAS